jgi:hypothetical protein
MQTRQGFGLSPIIASLVLILVGCSGTSHTRQVIYSSHLDSLDQVITRTNVTLDTSILNTGDGVMRFDSMAPTTVRLAEVSPKNAEDVTLVFRGHLRGQNFHGRAYLQIVASMSGSGDEVSKSPARVVTGTTDWVSQQSELYVGKGRKVQSVKLNVFSDGVGTLWIGPILLSQTVR